MLFFNQIRQEFTSVSWRRGQIYYRERRVKDVRLDGDVLMGKVVGSDKSTYDTAMVMARGTIYSSKCSCPAHRVYEKHCKHVAALAIWFVERGSLLRAGVGSREQGVAEVAVPMMIKDAELATGDPRLRKLLQLNPGLLTATFLVRKERLSASVEGADGEGRPISIPITLIEAAALKDHSDRADRIKKKNDPLGAEAVTFVRGYFTGKVLTAISLEPALRYVDSNHLVQVANLTYLTKLPEPGLYRNSSGLEIRVIPLPDEETGEMPDDILARAKVIYQGAAALENLAAIIGAKRRNVVIDGALKVELAPKTLKLKSINIGAKTEQSSRSLAYEFEGDDFTLTSEEMNALAKQGKLSSSYVWRGDQIYKLETSLKTLSQFANRSGVAASEDPEHEAKGFDGFGALHDGQDNPLHPIAAFRLSLELGAQNLVVDPNWKEFHDWRENFEKKKIPTLPRTSYGFDLRDYQKNGLTWLWSLYHKRLAALLADDMGLGKTHQVLAFLSCIYKKRAADVRHPSLVVAPTSVVSAWIQKLKKYDTGLKWSVFHGKGRALPASGVDIVLTTYGILQREQTLRDRDWHCVILDEAQAIKNSGTISARASRVLKSQFRIAMTGTPVENSSSDLWSLMEFLLPGYLGSLARFKRLYGSGREVPSQEQSAALKRLVSPFLLRRTKVQVLKELPEKTEEIVRCKLTAAQKKAYRGFLRSDDAEQVRKDLEGGGKIDYASILTLLTRLKQVCDHPRLPEVSAAARAGEKLKLDPRDSGKWEPFEELLSEALGSGLKVVVFTQYLGMMDLVGAWLEERGVGYTELRGDTADRASRLDLFAADPDCRVFLCSLLAGGLGIDLTAASVCIHMDRWWNPAKENQATDRLHRIGQTRGVQVFKLQIPGTVEDRIAGIIESKLELSGALIEESSAGLKAFDRRQLLELLQDVPESSGDDDDWDDEEMGEEPPRRWSGLNAGDLESQFEANEIREVSSGKVAETVADVVSEAPIALPTMAAGTFAAPSADVAPSPAAHGRVIRRSAAQIEEAAAAAAQAAADAAQAARQAKAAARRPPPAPAAPRSGAPVTIAPRPPGGPGPGGKRKSRSPKGLRRAPAAAGGEAGATTASPENAPRGRRASGRRGGRSGRQR